MRVEKEYSENCLRSDIWIEKELYDIQMRITSISEIIKKNDNHKKIADDLKKIESKINDKRIDFIKTFE